MPGTSDTTQKRLVLRNSKFVNYLFCNDIVIIRVITVISTTIYSKCWLKKSIISYYILPILIYK